MITNAYVIAHGGVHNANLLEGVVAAGELGRDAVLELRVGAGGRRQEDGGEEEADEAAMGGRDRHAVPACRARRDVAVVGPAREHHQLPACIAACAGTYIWGWLSFARARLSRGFVFIVAESGLKFCLLSFRFSSKMLLVLAAFVGYCNSCRACVNTAHE